jgi:hypothetical protein
MDTDHRCGSRRDFLSDAGRLASTVALAGCAGWPRPSAHPAASPPSAATAGAWDLGWMTVVEAATDRAVFDWPTLGEPADPIVLELAERYLDNCAAAYGSHRYDARVVLNIRTQAVAAALTDAIWERYGLGAEYKVTDPSTQQTATRNPFLHRAPDPAPGATLPTLGDLVDRGAIVLVCDFALGHLSKRLGTKVGRMADEVHRDLRAGLADGVYAVPSGIFGLARAQNSGCAYIRT